MSERQDAIDILNGMILDICVAVEVLRDYEHGDYPNRDALFRQGIYRLCLQSIILNLAKFTEFCREYGKLMHQFCPELTIQRNKIKEDLEKKKVNDIRSKYIAHNRCDKTKSPLSTQEIDTLLIGVIGSDSAQDFLDWLHPQTMSDADNPESFSGCISLVRDKLAKGL